METYMIGTYKFESKSEEYALQIAKVEMFKRGWRNLRLMKKETDGWEVCRVIPSFEKK